MKKFFLIIFSFLIINFTSAQIFYFSNKKGLNGITLGVEIFDQKTKTSLIQSISSYEWTVPEISPDPQKSIGNIIFLKFPHSLENLTLNFQATAFYLKGLTLKMPIYSDKNRLISLPVPKIKIIRKTADGILLPFTGKVRQNDFLTVITKDFSSRLLSYTWEFEGKVISDKKEIPVAILEKKNGIIKIKVTGRKLKDEEAIEEQKIQIE
jgi:hypothetical protein